MQSGRFFSDVYLEDTTMTAKEISARPETVVTMAPVPCTSTLTLVSIPQHPHMNPIQVRYQAALHPDADLIFLNIVT